MTERRLKIKCSKQKQHLKEKILKLITQIWTSKWKGLLAQISASGSRRKEKRLKKQQVEMIWRLFGALLKTLLARKPIPMFMSQTREICLNSCHCIKIEFFSLSKLVSDKVASCQCYCFWLLLTSSWEGSIGLIKMN